MDFKLGKGIRRGKYRFKQAQVKLPPHDCDLKVLFPNGRYALLQFRTDSSCLDIIFEDDAKVPVYNCTNGMDPAPVRKRDKSGHDNVDQLTIPLPFDYSVAPDPKEKIVSGVRLKNGRTGWRGGLRDNYGYDFESFAEYDKMYGISARLGYDDAESAWLDNPLIEGSMDPDDLRVVKSRRRVPRSPRK